MFLCAGFLEDPALMSNHADSQLRAYCLAPLTGVYHLDHVMLEPLPTTVDTTFSPTQREMVLRAGEFWLIVRAGPKTTNAIVRSLTRNLRGAGYPLRVLQRKRFGLLRVLQLQVDTHQ